MVPPKKENAQGAKKIQLPSLLCYCYYWQNRPLLLLLYAGFLGYS